jgi:hypothetical protein
MRPPASSQRWLHADRPTGVNRDAVAGAAPIPLVQRRRHPGCSLCRRCHRLYRSVRTDSARRGVTTTAAS